MKQRIFGFILILLSVFAATSIRAEEKEVAMTGEVVDMHCYLARHGGDGKGPTHAGCANSCISRGVTPGFLAADGTLYVLFDSAMTSPKEKIAGLAGKPVTITGVVIERDGVKAVRLVKVEEVPPK